LIIRLIKLLLAHGDYVAAVLPRREFSDEDRREEWVELINECKSDRKDREGWKERIHGMQYDGKLMGQCQAAIAQAVEVFGRIDILLCCTSEGTLCFLIFYIHADSKQLLSAQSKNSVLT
jgi:NAD(P)-dependent dehydrogenase (short-subunit alcohol dehydrogenase family)